MAHTTEWPIFARIQCFFSYFISSIRNETFSFSSIWRKGQRKSTVIFFVDFVSIRFELRVRLVHAYVHARLTPKKSSMFSILKTICSPPKKNNIHHVIVFTDMWRRYTRHKWRYKQGTMVLPYTTERLSHHSYRHHNNIISIETRYDIFHFF